MSGVPGLQLCEPLTNTEDKELFQQPRGCAQCTTPLVLPAESILVELKQIPFAAHDVFIYQE